MFNEKEYKDIVAAIRAEVKELKGIIEERRDAPGKVMHFLSDLSDKAETNRIPLWVSEQGYAISEARIQKIDEAFDRAFNIGRTLSTMWKQLVSIDKMYLEENIDDVAFDEKNGIPPISASFTEQEAIFYKQAIKEDREKLDKQIIKAQQIILDVREHLPETEIHFSEDMFSEETISQITGEKLKKFVDENMEKQEEQETPKAAPVNDIKKEAPKENKESFLARMKNFFSDTFNIVKETVIKVASSVKETIVNTAKKVVKKIVETKEAFIARIRAQFAGV